MVKLRLNLRSDSEDSSRSTALDGKTSSALTVAPTKDESLTWRWTEEKSWDVSPFTESTVRKNPSFVPGGIDPGAGEDDLVEEAEPLAYLEDNVMLTTFTSTRQEPMASAVYLQKIGTVDVLDNFLYKGARDMRAFPMKEYSGGGES